ncbi:Copper-activated transcription factor GRISEA [Rasamsonia emersonii CBS 393.64]|uniref:Copper-activated transcription factor GRISEA n=1 Tax=Rasamsonia emersonii (strain ATCC 16479 / CBS 393.64 / IMI 116815) TaxID=1408163 RepID=A0A0F4YNX6_RASE3|nr:Copper-activated transcription factor GRISEA [Rasamsonia emersonii CBS 393.64]KKA19561.1 Copper-activated transcription factor GRISEA [Rasamsonia emersonii CBS 393.64]
MPLDEEGAKWACEPCIRGHRSSKCQHFDRLMMKVPKAGRPLAKCPHPKGSCSCQKVYAFMVRIPKGSTEAPQSSGTPSVTASNPSAPGRIQKHSRRQSSLQAAPENIAKALNSASELQTASTSQPLPYPNFVQHSSASGFSASNQGVPTLLPKQTPNENEGVQTSDASCCSKRTEPVPAVQPSGSCCSKSQPTADNKDAGFGPEHVNFNPSWNEAPYSASQVPSWTQSHQMGQYASQNSNFAAALMQGPAYTNGFITSPYPVPQMNYSSTNFDGSSLGNHVSADQFVPNNSHGYPFVQPTMFGGDPAHECNCGDDCQCLGCAAHPFNNTTRQHVQEMGYMMSIAEEDENSESSTPFAGQMSPPTYPTTAVTSSNGLHSQGSAENTSTSTFDNVLSATASTDYTTPQLMQPSAYYTLEYPVGLPGACSNVTGTCQCGNDCSCIGCLTHSGHDGVTLEPAPAPAPDERATVGDGRPSQPSHEFADSTTAARTLDEFSPSALSPPMIEAPLV